MLNVVFGKYRIITFKFYKARPIGSNWTNFDIIDTRVAVAYLFTTEALYYQETYMLIFKSHNRGVILVFLKVEQNLQWLK